MGILGYEPLETQIPEAESAVSGMDGCASESGQRIVEIAPHSVAERAGIAAGERIVSVNGRTIADGIDLLFHGSEPTLEIEVASEGTGALRTVSVERSFGEELGLVLEDFKIKTCNNQCVFCFIHQNPKGLRRGLYLKDGDFRMSFLHGNYITTTNMSDADFERIIEQRLSPMYVSVHTTNDELRLKLLGTREAPPILATLQRLADGGIDFHTQIVLCPGLNDGVHLENTVSDLMALHPNLLSIAIVPLGLTDHRGRLPSLTPSDASFCARVIEQIEPVRAKAFDRYGEPVVFLSDEFYLSADRPLPDYSDCDVLHQLENGVGMVWDFMEPWERAKAGLPERVDASRSVGLLTGKLGEIVIGPIAEALNEISGLRAEVLPCENGLFGKSITVSGLLSGADFERTIAANPGHDLYLIPGNSVRAEGEVFLDNLSLADLKRRAGKSIQAIDGRSDDLIEAALAPLAAEALR